MRQAALTKGAAPQPPAARASREAKLHGAGRIAFQAGAESELLGGEAEKLLFRAAEESLAGAIYKAELKVVIESEDGEIDFFHHGAEERRGFEGAETLRTQRFAEGVHFDHDFAAGGAAAADGEILLAHGGENVGKSLQREDDAMLERDGEANPENKQEDGDGPGGAGGKVAGPEQNDGDEGTWEAGGQREELDAAFVIHHSRPCFWSLRYMALRLRPRALAAWLTLPSKRASVRWMRWRSTSSRLMSSRREPAPGR